jgi:hypothetical protein
MISHVPFDLKTDPGGQLVQSVAALDLLHVKQEGWQVLQVSVAML